MLSRRTQTAFIVLIVIAAPFLFFGFHEWRQAISRGGQVEAEPFRIAGNLYYVGASDITAFLLTSPEGHVLIDGGYPGSPPLIIASITRLGFNIRDVKILLNSEPLHDHAGGLAALQDSSGAQLWASEASAQILEAGGHDDIAESSFLGKAMVVIGEYLFPAPRVDRRFKDGDTVRLGSITLIAHITGGRSPGCTTWSIPLRDGDRVLNAVSACNLEPQPGIALASGQYAAELRAAFEHSFKVLRSLPADIFVTAHARDFDRYRKFEASQQLKNPAEAFIDRDGYKAYVDSAEARYRAKLAAQQEEEKKKP